MSAPLGAVEVHDLESEIVGDRFRIFVGRCGSDPQAALLVTDANGLFGLAVDTIRLMGLSALVPSLLVVGVGYPQADTLVDTVEIRSRDLTPTPSERYPGSGRADDFLRFLERELLPWLREGHPEAVADVTYFGHSLGGLFGAYALLTESTLFDRYILSSPSLWWDDEMIFDLEPTRNDKVGLNTSVFFGIGSLETDAGRRLEGRHLADGHPAKPPAAYLDMVADMRRFIAQLQSRSDDTLSLASVEIEDEFHTTVPGIVLNRGLRHFHP